jgi:hypothetical protein
MSDITTWLMLPAIFWGFYLAVRWLRTPQRRHTWGELDSSDVANAERRRRRPRP